MAVTIKIEGNKCILGYGVGWEAYFNHIQYKGFVEIIANVEGKLQASKENISKKGAGESYGKKEGY